MEIFSFTSDQAREIDQYGSRGASLTPLIQIQDLTVVSIQIGASGSLGAHPAAADQLFLVAAGDGYVSAGDQREFPVESGSAVFWKKGEIHATRAGKSGILAVVIEAEGLGAFISPPPGVSDL